MDPNSGRIISEIDLAALRISDPDDAAKFTVRLDGPPEDVRKVSDAVRSHYDAERRKANRAKNKAARKARRAGR